MRCLIGGSRKRLAARALKLLEKVCTTPAQSPHNSATELPRDFENGSANRPQRSGSLSKLEVEESGLTQRPRASADTQSAEAVDGAGDESEDAEHDSEGGEAFSAFLSRKGEKQ